MRIKKSTMSSLLVVLLLSIGSLQMQAQNRRGMGMGYNNPDAPRQARCENFIPDLTDDQKDQIKALRTKHQKESLPMRNEIRELHAKLITLETAETPDMKAINAMIDKIAAKKAALHKLRAKHRQEVRKVLTEDQRVIFDSRMARGGKGNGFYRGHGKRGRGYGQGYGPGRGQGCYRGY